MYYSGRDGSLYINGVKQARVAGWSLTASAESYDTTDLGAVARTYEAGVKNASGQATIFYHDETANPVWSQLLKGGAITDPVLMTLGWGNKRLQFNAWILQASLTCQVGTVMQVQISFTVDGDWQSVVL